MPGSFRFFPAVPDPEFGFRLHWADVATDKMLAAAGREEVRDAVDLITIHEHSLPLGAVALAAVAKDPGYSPEHLLRWVRRSARFQPEDLATPGLPDPLTPRALKERLWPALAEADEFVAHMPAGSEGKLYVDRQGRIVQPDPDRLSDYAAHEARQRGHWPRASTVQSAMLIPTVPAPRNSRKTTGRAWKICAGGWPRCLIRPWRNPGASRSAPPWRRFRCPWRPRTRRPAGGRCRW